MSKEEQFREELKKITSIYNKKMDNYSKERIAHENEEKRKLEYLKIIDKVINNEENER